MTDIQDTISKFIPFKDDGISISLPGLTIENASDKVTIRHEGKISDITNDDGGRHHANFLVAKLSGKSDLISTVIYAVASACLTHLNKDPKALPERIKIRPTIEMPGDPFS